MRWIYVWFQLLTEPAVAVGEGLAAETLRNFAAGSESCPENEG